MLSRSICVALALFCGSTLFAQQKPALPDVLQAAAGYVANFSKELGTVAAEEEYNQADLTRTGYIRRLNADVVFVGLDTAQVAFFRDVYSLDANKVRERDGRLLTLFKAPATEALQAQAQAIQEEGYGHYLSPNLRSLDAPMLALDYLRQQAQSMSEFKLDRMRTMDGAQVAILKFKTPADKKVLPTPEGSTSEGTFYVEMPSGTIRQTELAVNHKMFNFMVRVKYEPQESVGGLWLPVEAIQQCDLRAASSGMSNMGAGGNLGSRQSLEGRTKYSKFRRPN